MVSLNIVIAIAASAAAFLIVVAVVAVVVWVRVRKERHAMRMLGLKEGENPRTGKTYNPDTLTELSHQEGSVLRAHGQLPYGKPTEWGQLASRETLLRPKAEPESSWPLMERARSLRNSLRRARSKRFTKGGHWRMGSMATVSETVSSPAESSKDDIPLSAVEGVLELPAERTPRHTPELSRGNDGFHVGMRPMSPASAWPPPAQRERANVFPVMDNMLSQDLFDPAPVVVEEPPTRIRGGSIVSRSAGHVPEQSVPPPPPPAALSQERFSYLRNDSVMRLSSMSLDTTNSSILDDGRNASRPVEPDLTSPTFPSSGTFVPFSANDVGVKNGRRSFIAANTSMPPNFLMRSSSNADGYRKSSGEMMSPRRSMTTASRNPSNSSNRSNRLSRRSGSLSSKPPQRNSSLRGTPMSMTSHQNANDSSWRTPTSNGSPAAHAGQRHQKQPLIYGGEPCENDPFYGSSPASSGTLFSVGSPSQPPVYTPQSPMQRSSLSIKGPLPSALKGSSSQRKTKGHRRQNCVRISIHPAMTFGGPAFSPTLEEEPGDFDVMEEVDLRESAINGAMKSQPSVSVNATSPVPLTTRGSGSRRTKPMISAPSSLGPLAEEPQPSLHTRTPSKKRKKAPTDNPDDTPVLTKTHALPGLFTAIPPTRETNLSHTASPEREPPAWVSNGPSPTTYEISPNMSNGSPRRPPLKGPRTQPGKSARGNATHTSQPKSTEPLLGATSSTGLPLITGTQGSDWRKSGTTPVHRPRTDTATGSYSGDRRSQSSISHGFDSAMRPVSPVYGSKTPSVRDKVTIWEDANRSASPTKPSATPFAAGYTFQLDTNLSSMMHAKSNVPRSLSKNEPQSPVRVSSQRAPPTPASAARSGLMTPTGKGLGIGVPCATPVSLYDGEGFLKE